MEAIEERVSPRHGFRLLGVGASRIVCVLGRRHALYKARNAQIS